MNSRAEQATGARSGPGLALIGGFAPLLVFGFLLQHAPVVLAGALSALAAVAVLLVLRRTVSPMLLVTSAAVLLVIAASSAVGGSGFGAVMQQFGRGAATIAVAGVLLVTAWVYPFTAAVARSSTPAEAWSSPRFQRLNTRLSVIWAVLFLAAGTADLGVAVLVGGQPRSVAASLVLWAPNVAAVFIGLSVTRHEIEAAA